MLAALVTAFFIVQVVSDTVLVTGASSGIGKDSAKLFASQGYNVVVCARRVHKLDALVEEIRDFGGKAVAVPCDVSNVHDVENAFKVGETVFGSIDYVFANAGYEGSLDPIEGWSEDILETINVNILGSLATYLQALKSFKKNPTQDHAIIFTSSIAAQLTYKHGTELNDFSSHPNVYSMSKAAVDALIRFAGGQNAGGIGENKPVRVYGVAPAIYETEMVEKILDTEFMRSRNIRTPSDYAKFNTVFPGKVGKPSHVAQAVLAMIDGTTGWKSGDVVVMDNDATYHVHEHYKVATIVKDEIWRIDRTKVYDVTGNHLYDFEKVKSDL